MAAGRKGRLKEHIESDRLKFQAWLEDKIIHDTMPPYHKVVSTFLDQTKSTLSPKTVYEYLKRPEFISILTETNPGLLALKRKETLKANHAAVLEGNANNIKIELQYEHGWIPAEKRETELSGSVETNPDIIARARAKIKDNDR